MSRASIVRRVLRVAALAVLATGFAGCVDARQPAPVAAAVISAAPAAKPPAEPRPANPADYRLGAGDKIRIIVYNETTLTGEFIVAPSGTIALPLIGTVNALDRTVGDLEVAIAAKLREGYVRDPRVSIEVLTYRPFYILGEVNHPGEYPYTAGLTVTRAVATAQGYTYRANTRRVFIKHAGDTTEARYPADGGTLVMPGDIIRVTERLF